MPKQRIKGKKETIATTISVPMYRMMNNIIATNAHVNIADYLRDLVRQDLIRRGFVEDKLKNKETMQG